MKSRQYSVLDQAIMALDSVLSGTGKSDVTQQDKRPYPAAHQPEVMLNEEMRQHVSGLMRVNHAGEVAAQALYKAQALTARDTSIKQTMQQSANEEIDHLHWCEQRLQELGDHSSYLAPAWFLGSFSIGLLAGCFGDKWNLGFLAETEHQVVRHLDAHLEQLPLQDQRSRSILEQMRKDELDHAVSAETAGGEVLPSGIKRLMNLTSKIMTMTAYKF